MKTVKRGEEKDSVGSKEEAANVLKAVWCPGWVHFPWELMSGSKFWNWMTSVSVFIDLREMRSPHGEHWRGRKKWNRKSKDSHTIPILSGQLRSHIVRNALWWAGQVGGCLSSSWPISVNLRKIILAVACSPEALKALFFIILIPADLSFVHFWHRFLGLAAVYTFWSGRGFSVLVLCLQVSSSQLIPANVTVAHSENRLYQGLLEKFNSFYLLVFLYREIPASDSQRA